MAADGVTNGTANGNQRPELQRPRASQHPSWSGLILRQPGKDDTDFEPPSLEWLAGTWHFTHSTLPIWKDKRNVRVWISAPFQLSHYDADANLVCLFGR